MFEKGAPSVRGGGERKIVESPPVGKNKCLQGKDYVGHVAHRDPQDGSKGVGN